MALASGPHLACSDDSATGLRVIASFDEALGVDRLDLEVTVQDAKSTSNSTPRADAPLVSPYTVLVVTPDEWGGRDIVVKIAGAAKDTVRATGGGTGRLEADKFVDLRVQLSVPCDDACVAGSKECVGDQSRSCEVDISGCARWSPPGDCPADRPFCSEGSCGDQCKDECAAQQRRCTDAGVQVCGQHDSDTCTDWGPTLSCQPDELCLDGQCLPDCGGAPCDCEAGQTQACKDIGQCKGGVRQCEGGRFGACQWQVGPAAEQCDGVDNDCDDQTDEELVAPPCSLQQGVCKGALGTCTGQGGWQNCSAQDYAAVAASNGLTYEADETLCDGKDNDCDGLTDEAEGCCPSDCAGKACGADDGCGNPCQSGSCEQSSQTCQAGVCVCQPDCAGKLCGADDGCGKPCQSGSCANGNEVCQSGVCVCEPSCTNKTCGADDGCGGVCTSGSCGANQSCVGGVCQCSHESCYGTCCADGQVCASGSCCTPNCAGRQCGVDPVCGASCGSCAAGAKCTDDGTCKLGPEWEQVASPSSEQYAYPRGVHGTSASDVWVVGDGGLILHYDGAGWSLVTSPVQKDLLDVFALSPSVAWAVGDSGTVLKYDGASWTEQTTEVDPQYDLHAIWASSTSNVWVVGRTTYYSKPIAYRFNGSSWSVSLPGAMLPYGICGSSSSNVWIVGKFDIANSRKVARYDGSKFVGPDIPSSDASCSSSSTCAVNACWAASSNNVWAVGTYGGIFHYDGGAWTKVYSGLGASTDSIEGIWGSSGSDIWAVWKGMNTRGLLHYNGTGWSKVTAPAGQYFTDIWGSSSQDIWAVAYPDTLLHYVF